MSQTTSWSRDLERAAKVMPALLALLDVVLGILELVLTNSRLARSAKSLIGNTERKTSCRPDWVRLAAGVTRCRKPS